IKEANENAKKAGVTDRVTFKQGNLFEQKLDDANVLTMYLLSSVNLQLRPKILAEMKPGSRVVSHAFTMGDWDPDQDATVPNRIYLWIVPAKVDGTWQAESGARKFTLNLKQTYQKLTGTATVEGKTASLTGRLNGDAIEIETDLGGGTTKLRGVVKGRA